MKQEKQEKGTPIGAVGEFGLIEKLTGTLAASQPTTIYGIGDDAAVLGTETKKAVITTDLLMENVHFDLHYCPLKHLGYKAVMVNLSDIYAMNAYPSQITVSLAISSKFSVEAIEEIYEGMRHACQEHQVDIVGGDTTASQKGLSISITAIGWEEEKNITYRNGAQEGDFICVSGDLGAAYMGLLLLEREKQVFLSNPDVQPDLEGQRYLVERQLKPVARRDVIDLLRRTGMKPTSMMDLSDGLASDIMQIAKASHLGAALYEKWLPIHQDVKSQAIDFRIDPSTAALNGGEDYELLMTFDASAEDDLHELDGITVVGRMKKKDKGIKLITDAGNEHDIIAQGWQHFQKDN